MLAHMRFFEGDLDKARCRQPDVDPSWWLEPDYDTNDVVTLDPHEVTGAVYAQAHSQAMNTLLVQSREDMLRAKILCHECPLYNECQGYGWMEGAHVWGGLDAGERYKVLKAGSRDVLPKPPKGRYLEENEVITRFLKGESVEGIVQSTGMRHSSVMNRIRGTLAALRKQREDNKWNSSERLPTLPVGMVREAYRRGAALLPTSEQDSA